ncbi:AraC-like ligand-binding domain-containing protein [Zobellella maritima]|uniref:AraC-like ligand-binding domain-containing protein n=1 Tax=Zobellella maritima TaxID=2059725 RepID=UPI0018E52F83|nr:helix-turn-helix domain-containing protein [Zobellella maritima]
MHSCHQTTLLPMAERQDYWKGVIGSTYFDMALRFNQQERFFGQLWRWEVPPFSISFLSSSPTCYQRLKQHIHQHEDHHYLITIPEQSEVSFSQDRRSVRCRPGAFILERSDKPYEFEYGRDNSLWVLRVPGSLLRSRLRLPERYLFAEFDRSQGLGAVFFDYFRSITNQVAYLDDQQTAVLLRQLIELFSLAVEGDERAIASEDSSLRQVHVQRVEQYIRQHIRSSQLSPESIAHACGISVRYLHKLFEGAELSVGQWIKEIRLQSALADIRQPGGRRTLADIAYKWGFNDQAHFCRCFKTRFGITPKQARQEG